MAKLKRKIAVFVNNLNSTNSFFLINLYAANFEIIILKRNNVNTNKMKKRILKVLKFGLVNSTILFYQYIKKKSVGKSYVDILKLLIKSKKIDLINIESANSERTINLVNNFKPQIGLSILFDQIIYKDLLDIPEFGFLNIHPGKLPNYRGVMPTFWTLLNNEDHATISLHYMDEKIDNGPVINYIHKKVKTSDSVYGLVHSLVLISCKPFIKDIKNILNSKGTKNRDNIADIGNYYSSPEKEHITAFFSRNKSFF